MSPRTEGEIYYNQIEGLEYDSSDDDQIEGLEYDSSDDGNSIDEEIAEMEKEIAEMEKEIAETNERTIKLEEITSLQNKLTRIWKEIWEMTFVLEKRNLKIPDGCRDMINEANKLDSQASHLVTIDHFERTIKLFQEALYKLKHALQLLEDEYMRGWVNHLEWVNQHIKEVEEDIEMSKTRLISLQRKKEQHTEVIIEIEQRGYNERMRYLDQCRANLKQEEAYYQKEQNAKLGEDY